MFPENLMIAKSQVEAPSFEASLLLLIRSVANPKMITMTPGRTVGWVWLRETKDRIASP